jgi:hypothetical protein
MTSVHQFSVFRENWRSRLWASIGNILFSSVFQFVDASWVIWIDSFFGKYPEKMLCVRYEDRDGQRPTSNKWSRKDSRNIEVWFLHEHLSELNHIYSNNSLRPWRIWYFFNTADSNILQFDAGCVACRTAYWLVTIFRGTGFVSWNVVTSRYPVVLLRRVRIPKYLSKSIKRFQCQLTWEN